MFFRTLTPSRSSPGSSRNINPVLTAQYAHSFLFPFINLRLRIYLFCCVQEMANHIFQTCYNLCRLNKLRQEEAAQAGIIPSLMRVIESQSPLKQFALPILCDLASAGKSCRMLLWQHDGLAMYIRLLADPYFQVSALESILSWYAVHPFFGP